MGHWYDSRIRHHDPAARRAVRLRRGSLPKSLRPQGAFQPMTTSRYAAPNRAVRMISPQELAVVNS